MIRKSIMHTMDCTFIVHVPGPDGFPYPMGTGFFVSGEGHFITASHVIEGVNTYYCPSILMYSLSYSAKILPSTGIGY